MIYFMDQDLTADQKLQMLKTLKDNYIHELEKIYLDFLKEVEIHRKELDNKKVETIKDSLRNTKND